MHNVFRKWPTLFLEAKVNTNRRQIQRTRLADFRVKDRSIFAMLSIARGFENRERGGGDGREGEGNREKYAESSVFPVRADNRENGFLVAFEVMGQDKKNSFETRSKKIENRIFLYRIEKLQLSRVVTRLYFLLRA